VNQDNPRLMLPRLDPVDLTGPQCRYVEVMTDAGIVRVTAALVSASTKLPVMVTEVEVNDNRDKRTEAGGQWQVRGQPAYTFGRYSVRAMRLGD
jgi:hypothetical protein